MQLDKTLDSTMFRPISEERSAVLPSCFLRPEGLNKFSVEMYLVLFLKLLDFIFRLTPENLQKSLAFFSLFSARHATITKCETIVFMSYFAQKLSVLTGWFKWDQLRSMR